MKKKFRVKQSGLVFLLTLSILSVSCSSDLIDHKITPILPENTSESCEQFVGRWLSLKFRDTKDEDRIICGDKPCYKDATGGGGFILTCTDGKISGEAIVMSVTNHTYSNISVPTEKHETVREDKTSFRDIRIENGVLHLSFFYESGGNCLSEISVSPKGKFLLGTYQTTGCRQVGDSGDRGSILFKRN